MSNFARDHCRLMVWKKKAAKDFIMSYTVSVYSCIRNKCCKETTTEHDNSAWLRTGKASWCRPGRKKNGRQQTNRGTIRTELQLLNNSLRFLRVMLQCFSQWIQWTIIRIIFQEDKTCFFLFITLIQGKNGVKYIKMAVRVILSFLKLNQAKLVKKSNKSC